MKRFGIILKDFSGGLNLKYDDDLMSLNEARNLRNCDPYSKGWIDRRMGCSKLTSDGIGSEVSVSDGIRFYPTSSTKELIIATNNAVANKIWKINDSTGVETEITGGTALQASTRVRFQIYKGTLFINDGTAPIQYYTSGITKADISGTPTPPTGSHYCIHKRRMYVANGANLYYSNVGLFAGLPDCDFPADNIEPIGDETLVIIGMIPQQDHIVIFKENTFHKWIGTADYDFRVLDTNRPYGSIASDSITMCEGWVLFLSHDGVRAYDGGLHCILLSDKITPIIDGSSSEYGMEVTTRSTAYGKYHDGLYYLSYRGKNSTYNNKEIVFNFRSWLESNGKTFSWYYNTGRNISCYIPYTGGTDQNELMIGDSNAPYIYKTNDGYTDQVYGCITNGNKIDMMWQTKKLDTFEGATAHDIKKFRKIKASTYLQGGTFELGFDVDNQRLGSTSIAQTTSSHFWGDGRYWHDGTYWTSSVLREINLGLDENLVGRNLAITVREQSGSQRARVHNIELTGKAKPYK